MSARISSAERETLEAAAVQALTDLSDFMLRKALEAAEMELLVHPRVAIPAAEWARFEAWVHQPAKPVRALRNLAAVIPTWDD